MRDVQPRLEGRAVLVRYADDFVITFERETDARRVHDVLPKRFAKYGLTLHPEKTRLVEFNRPHSSSDDDDDGPGTFDLLGFTHHWGLSQRGNWVVKKRTAGDRFGRALKRVTQWCRLRRHDSIQVQSKALAQKLRGHYAYYGITGNADAIGRFYFEVIGIWHKWLSRRSHRAYILWANMKRILERFPLPKPRLVHRYGT